MWSLNHWTTRKVQKLRRFLMELQSKGTDEKEQVIGQALGKFRITAQKPRSRLISDLIVTWRELGDYKVYSGSNAVLANDLSPQIPKRSLPLLSNFGVNLSFPKESYTCSCSPNHLKGSVLCQELHPLGSLSLSILHLTHTQVELTVPFCVPL